MRLAAVNGGRHSNPVQEDHGRRTSSHYRWYLSPLGPVGLRVRISGRGSTVHCGKDNDDLFCLY
jgi:hypothetical protein